MKEYLLTNPIAILYDGIEQFAQISNYFGFAFASRFTKGVCAFQSENKNEYMATFSPTEEEFLQTFPNYTIISFHEFSVLTNESVNHFLEIKKP